MSKIAIVIEDCKLKTFKRHLKDDGFTYEILKGPLTGHLTLTVNTEAKEKLAAMASAAMLECHKQKFH